LNRHAAALKPAAALPISPAAAHRLHKPIPQPPHRTGPPTEVSNIHRRNVSRPIERNVSGSSSHSVVLWLWQSRVWSPALSDPRSRDDHIAGFSNFWRHHPAAWAIMLAASFVSRAAGSRAAFAYEYPCIPAKRAAHRSFPRLCSLESNMAHQIAGRAHLVERHFIAWRQCFRTHDDHGTLGNRVFQAKRPARPLVAIDHLIEVIGGHLPEDPPPE